MSPFIGLLHVVQVVLMGGGILKLLRPAAASRAMVSAGLVPPGSGRQRFLAARMVGLVEITVGVGALVVASPFFLVLAGGLYGAFDLFLWRLRRVAGRADCGCFGSSSSPAGSLHYWLNGLAAVLCAGAAVASAAGTPVGLGRVNTLSATLLVSYWVLVLVLAWLIAVGPSLVGAVDPKTVAS